MNYEKVSILVDLLMSGNLSDDFIQNLLALNNDLN